MVDVLYTDQTPLNADARTVLTAVRTRSMDGYALQSRTGFDRKKLVDALEELLHRSLIRVTGSMDVEGVGDSVISVPLDAIGVVDLVLRNR